MTDLYAYKEIYKTGVIKPDLIELIKENCDPHEDRIRYAAVDSADQDGVAQLKLAGFRVNEPPKDKVAQIQVVQKRLKVDETGQPGIFFLRDRLVHPPDETLKEKYLPVEVTDEFLGLSYSEKRTGNPQKDDAETDGEKHGIDGTSYLVRTLEKGPRGIGSGRVIHGSVKMR